MEKSRGNVNVECSNLFDCYILDIGHSRPLCPENCKLCPYSSEYKTFVEQLAAHVEKYKTKN